MRRGFTIIELLVILALLAILGVIAMTGWQLQLKKGRDARRKSDLGNVAVALRHYHEDNGCFPNSGSVTCSADLLAPYIDEVPCDPTSQDQQVYVYVSDSCNQFVYYTKLEFTNDPVIEKVGCTDGCGPGSFYNYYVSSGNIPDLYVAPPTPTPSPTPTPGILPATCGDITPYCYIGECGSCCPDGWCCNEDGVTCSPSEE